MDARSWHAFRLPQLLLPQGGFLTVLEAYFDESEREGGIFCVAGYVFTPLQAGRFNVAWHRTMGPYWPFHMSEFVHGRDKKGTKRPTKFESLTQIERDALLRKAVNIINKRIALSISVACSVNDVRRLAPILGGAERDVFESRGLFENAYSLCCYMCMTLLANWILERDLPDRVAYVFESGNRFQAQADQLMRVATFHPALREMVRYKSHAFVDKTDSAPLQAADLFAWELTKFLDETAIRKIRPPRKSLMALVAPNPSRYEGRVLHAAGLEKYFKKLAGVFSGDRP
jgi:uncharacterized protein DUF3800